MLSINEKKQAMKLKIKTCMDEDIRLLRGDFMDWKDAFSTLQEFITKSYNVSSSYIMQYKDDEKDLITIAKELDLEDAINQAKQEGKCAKIYIKTAAPASSKKQTVEVKDGEEKKDDTILTGRLVQDIQNEQFRAELISFLKTVALLYKLGSENNNQADLMACIVSSLSQHPLVSEHAQVKALLPQLNFFVPQLEGFAPFLLTLDDKKIDEMINNFITKKQSGCGMFNPFMMFNCCNEKNCPGKHGLQLFYVPTNTFFCDGCQKKMIKNHPMYGCRTCDYDLCSLCYNGFEAKNCPGKHGLAFFHTNTNRYGCDGCSQKMGMHAPMLGCRSCNYDLCLDCFYNKKVCKGRRRRCYKKFDDKKTYIVNIIDNPMPIMPNTIINPNEGIIKKWKLKNAGSNDLPIGLLVKYSGRRNNPMVSTQNFVVGNTKPIKPDEEFIVQVCVKAPSYYGKFSSNWRLCTPDGKKFGEKLPFDLVLSGEVNNNMNNNDDNKKDDAPKIVSNIETDSEIENLTDKVVNMVVNENENESEKKGDEEENMIDMIINDSDDESGDKKDDKADPVVKEPVKEEVEVVPEQVIVEPEPEPEPEPVVEEVYQYAAELAQLESMGFNADGGKREVLKVLLEEKKGSIEEVINVLFNIQ